MDPIDVYQLQIGDKFMEDCYPTVYKVVRKKRGQYFPLVIAIDLETNEEVEFGYSDQIYSPKVIRIK